MVTSKQLLPDMINYTYISRNRIRSTSHDLPNFKKLLGNRSQLRIKLSYKEQPSLNGFFYERMIVEHFKSLSCIGTDA